MSAGLLRSCSGRWIVVVALLRCCGVAVLSLSLCRPIGICEGEWGQPEFWVASFWSVSSFAFSASIFPPKKGDSDTTAQKPPHPRSEQLHTPIRVCRFRRECVSFLEDRSVSSHPERPDPHRNGPHASQSDFNSHPKCRPAYGRPIREKSSLERTLAMAGNTVRRRSPASGTFTGRVLTHPNQVVLEVTRERSRVDDRLAQ